MAEPRRPRVSLHPADADALAIIAELVSADAEGSAQFGGFYGRAPERLGPLLGPERRAWLVRAGAEPVGFVDAELEEGCVHLTYFVVSRWRRRGVARTAVGTFLGLAVWPDARCIRASIEPGNEASAGAARAAGFAVARRNAHGEDEWERPAPLPRASPVSPQRYLRRDGRIDRYPVKAQERDALLAWIAAQVLAPGEVVPEREITTRLSAFADDVVLLRRYLVDHELVERTRSGSQYALVTE